MDGVSGPWLEWWQDFVMWWRLWRTPPVLRQLFGLVVVLGLAWIVDRLLRRFQARRMGNGLSGQRKIPAVLWAARFPLLVLLLGGLALAVYSAAGWPTRTLQRLVSLFWFVAAYAVVAKSLEVLLPPGQARRIISRVLLPLLAVLVVLHLVGLLPVLWAWASAPALAFASTRITPASIGLGVLIVIGSVLAAKWGKALFMRAIVPRTHADPKLARSVAGFVQLVIVILGCWIALRSLGVEFSNLTLLLSALTVGIGFGLQDVIKNVMGGVILLSEGHMRPGEVFEIGGETGVVERIGLRSTTIRAWDRSLVIVPNSYLIAEKVSDLTGSQRVEVTVGVSCDADPRLVERLLLEMAAAHPLVLDAPEPTVFFATLGESSFDFVLYCFVRDRSEVIRTRSDLHYTVVETFRANGVEMPYPQRDLHLRSGPWGQMPVPHVDKSGDLR